MSRSTGLLTDRYELTMLDAALHDGLASTPCVFEVFARSLPAGRRFGVVAGTGRLLDALENFRFDPEQITWLRENSVVSDEALEYLAAYKFAGTVSGYREGELYFPHSPILTIETDFGHGVLLETLVLSVLNYDSAIASAAARMSLAAGGRPLAEMGSRRANEDAAVAGTRAAYIAGFSASSNLEAGRVWGIPTMGTAAHAFTLLHETEKQAFESQIRTMGVGTTLLVDTYNIPEGVRTAVEVAGTGLGGVRIDSGDLESTASAVRKQLDALGATSTKITVTNDLDEFSLAALKSSPVDNYGVGTAVLTGSGAPTCGMVYKLTARQLEDGSWASVQKTSAGKAHVGGRKSAIRELNSKGRAVQEVIGVNREASTAANDSGRSLLVTLVDEGVSAPEYCGPEGVQAAKRHFALAMGELPESGKRLSRGEPAIPTVWQQ